MRAAIPLLSLLLACATPPPEAKPEDPAALLELLGHSQALRREEGAFRLSLAGGIIPDSLAGHERALAFAEEDTLSMRQGVSLALEERDPQRMVWRAYHAIRAGCLARPWSRVSEALSRQGFRLIEIYEPHERSRFVRLFAQPGAWTSGAGDRHDLFFWVRSARKDGGSWTVREVYVGLVVKFDAPFKQLASTDRYPRGSVLARFFELPELAKLAIVFPHVEELEFTYGRIRDKEADVAAAGFHVNAGFLMEGKAGGRSIYYTAEAGLDPREMRRGRLDWNGFSSSDVVGPLTPRGTGFWGAGGPKPSED
jgi:transposase-like protein